MTLLVFSVLAVLAQPGAESFGLAEVILDSEVVSRQGYRSKPSRNIGSNPDICNIDATQSNERRSYVASVEHYFDRLGFDEFVFLRGLDICEFSFGYTRVGSTPSIKIKDREMPVRLRAFDYVERGKRPIYLLEQKNEGFYLRLDETRVIEWLRQNGLGDKLPPRDDMKLRPSDRRVR